MYVFLKFSFLHIRCCYIHTLQKNTFENLPEFLEFRYLTPSKALT